MAFFQSAVGTLQTLVVALGAGLGIWGAINLMEGYGNDNPGANSQGSENTKDRQQYSQSIHSKICCTVSGGIESGTG